MSDTGVQPLTYPYSDLPDRGAPVDVVPTVKWLRLPMPFALDHVNIYLIKGDEGWLIVDTGPDTPEVRSIWDELFSGPLRNERITGVLCTHFHIDHAGLAGYLTERRRIPLFMTYREYFTLCASPQEEHETPWRITEFYRRTGLPDEQVRNILTLFPFSPRISPPPPSFVCLPEGFSLSGVGDDWRVLVGQGHSPEPALLFSAGHGILISGDQMLPRISSNVSVSSVNPEDEPLSRWLESLDRLAELPADTLVLPAHGLPFRGLRSRVAELHGQHGQKLRRILECCASWPSSVFDLIPVIYKSPLADFDLFLAVGECLSHCRYLLNRGSVHGESDRHGVVRYRLPDAAEEP